MNTISLFEEQLRIAAYLDGFDLTRHFVTPSPVGRGDWSPEGFDELSTGFSPAKELRPLFGRTLMASILDKAFKGEL